MPVLSELRKPPGYELDPAVLADILPIDGGHMSRLRSHPSLARQDSVLGLSLDSRPHQHCPNQPNWCQYPTRNGPVPLVMGKPIMSPLASLHWQPKS